MFNLLAILITGATSIANPDKPCVAFPNGLDFDVGRTVIDESIHTFGPAIKWSRRVKPLGIDHGNLTVSFDQTTDITRDGVTERVIGRVSEEWYIPTYRKSFLGIAPVLENDPNILRFWEISFVQPPSTEILSAKPGEKFSFPVILKHFDPTTFQKMQELTTLDISFVGCSAQRVPFADNRIDIHEFIVSAPVFRPRDPAQKYAGWVLGKNSMRIFFSPQIGWTVGTQSASGGGGIDWIESVDPPIIEDSSSGK